MISADITKKLGSYTLHAVLESNEKVTALLGASGSGKSVTLKCIAGIMTPDKGYITVNGRTLFDSDKKINVRPEERHIGYLFQSYALFPHMTVRENILSALHPKVKRKEISRKDSEEKADWLISRFSLQGLENRLPSRISGGQQQRTALARIMASEPDMLLLDEPLSALDISARWSVELELLSFLDAFEGQTLYVSHDMREVSLFARHAVIMENGISSPMRSTSSVITHPSSPAEASLSGEVNISHAVKDGEYVTSSLWNLKIRSDLSDVNYMVLPQRAIGDEGDIILDALYLRTVTMADEVFSLYTLNEGTIRVMGERRDVLKIRSDDVIFF
ncbi:MAG: sulfate/molybdate ABC transporter ATP-binding protein [Bullifex sp.]